MRRVGNVPKAVATKRPWWRLGPGTIVALMVGAAVLGWQISRPPDPNMGRILYESDASGHLHRVAAPSVQAAPQSVLLLWKPEVSLLLERGPELHLTATQRIELQKLDAVWSREKADRQQRLRVATGDADTLLQRSVPDRSTSLTVVRSSLEDYSRLSEEYVRRRSEYWTQAIGLLTAKPRQQFDRIRSSVNRK
ncbi:MAG: hypothetical protein JWL77_2053 [Chthonomonadaceae bacterium]|nr:hypothetical protein [Chthonomonadaceae bacterium]